MEPILKMSGITKAFNGNVVLSNVHFDLYKGEVHSLIGENGAGKSTLMKILMGLYQADEGSILIDGEQCHIDSPATSLKLGIAMIHQELAVIPDMTIAENIFVGREIRKRGFVDNKEQEKYSASILQDIGLNISPKMKMRDLSVSEMQMVEIVKTISRGANIIIMDEPTSAITEAEAKKLFNVIKHLCAQGVGIIYISHKMDELFEISNRVTVLRDGNLIGTSDIEKVSRQELIHMMVGRDISAVYPRCENTRGEIILSVKNLTRNKEFYDISFNLYKGERLGIGGLIGAGRSELVMAIFGKRKAQSGEIWLKGSKINISSPQVAIRNRIALITEDRKRYGLNLLSSTENNILSVIEYKLSKMGFFQFKKADTVSDNMIKRLNIKVNSPRQIVSYLSGGNQQKVVLAKWLAEDIDIFIFDEPTRGIDVGAKAEIYKIINELAMQGKGIILISSELPELIGMSDRIIVLHDKHYAGELKKEEMTQENVMTLASGNMIHDGGYIND